MDLESLKKNLIFQDHRKFELIQNSELDKIKNNQINNTIIDLIISDILSDKTSQDQFNKYLIITPDTTNILKEDFQFETKENLIDLLAKFQMTNIMNKEFLIFFYYNKQENFSQLIIINYINTLIENIINNNFGNFSSNISESESNSNNNYNPNNGSPYNFSNIAYSAKEKEKEKESNLKFCFMIINIIYENEKENDKESDKEKYKDNINSKYDFENDNIRFSSKKSSNLTRLNDSLR